MKKVLSLVLVLTMVLGSFSMAFAAAPNDVVGTEYEDAVERLIQLGVLTGYTDGTFKPENTITRSEFAAAVVRAKGLKAAAEAAQGATAFADVPANNWASGYVNVASKMGFVKGYPNGNFGLNDPITYEQAVTLVVRALGYEPAAMSKGGYPYGYLIVANEIELLDSVKGTQGLPAPRGLVAQLIDNALETPLMVQVSYGDRVEHIVSGSRDGVEEKTLLSELNFTKVTGRVTEINEDKSLIRIGDKSLKVAEGFDFQEALGLKLRAWYNDSDKIILYTKLDTPMFDAVEHDDGGLYLYGEDKTYDLATDKDDKVIATLILDGKTVKTSNVEDFDADYAKVVLDSYGDIIWVEGFTFDGNIAVEKLDGNVVESYGYEELSLKNYTIVKEGKTISVDDLEENDIVFYNKDNKFAVVANITAEGTIEKVYTDRFVVAGETYDIDGRYLDADEMDDLSSAALDSMRKEEKEATVFFDFKGNVVLVVGTRAASTTASNYFLLAEVSNEWTDYRNNVEYYSLDVLNAEGKIVKYDVKQSEVNDDDDTVEFITPSDMSKDWMTVLGDEDNAEKLILKLTLNTKDKVTAVEVLENHEISDDLKVTAGYVGGFKLQDSTVIFRADGEAVEDYAVTTWAKAEEEFSKIELGKYYVGANGRVVAIFAEETDAPDADLEYYGRIKDVRELRNGLKEVVILSEGEEHTFVTESKTIDGFAELKDYAMVKITVVNKTEEIRKVEKLVPVNAKIEDLKPGSKIIETDKGEFELTEKAVIYKAPRVSTLRFADLEIGDYLDIYTRTGSSRFAIYAVKVDGPTTPTTTATAGVVTYINSDDTQLVIDGEIYRANDDTIVKDADGNVIGLGDFSAIAVGDDVVVEGNVYTITLTKTEKDAAAEAEALAEAIEAAEAAQADYLAAGGLDTDAVYVAVQDALDADPQVRADIEAATDALVAATAALTADQDMVNAELAKVTDPVVLTGSTAVTDANIKTAVEALVDLNKVTVTVSANATEGWDVTLTSKVEGSTAEKTVAATNEDTLAVEAAIAKVPATLNPVEGTDTNVKDMVEAAIDDDASTTFVTALDASGNTQVGIDGAITYDTTEVTGDVVFTITVGSMSDTVTVSVTVPMSAAAADQAMVDAELAKVSDVELANGTDLTADQSALVKAEVEKSVDLNKVTVTVTKGSDDNTYNVKLDSRVAAGTANKDITVTVAAE